MLNQVKGGDDGKAVVLRIGENSEGVAEAGVQTLSLAFIDLYRIGVDAKRRDPGSLQQPEPLASTAADI